MNPIVISVRAAAGGWAVECGLIAGPLMFASGACAEREARLLARAATRVGRCVELAIHDREGSLVARVELRPAEGLAVAARRPADVGGAEPGFPVPRREMRRVAGRRVLSPA